MIERIVIVTNRLGLHARAAAHLVRTANMYQSTVILERVDGNGSADAKSILNVLMLAASQGTELRVSADGDDAENAVEAIARLFTDGFGESD
jgi:phosphocarrier protein